MVSSPYPHSDRDLLQRIGRSAGGKAGYKQLVRELGLGGGRERRLLLEQLSRIVARGELRQPKQGVWAIPAAPAASAGTADPAGTAARRSAGTSASGRSAATESRGGAINPGFGDPRATDHRSGRDRLLSGRLELHRDGFGFVRLESKNGTRSAEAQDIFIPPVALHGAMHGDLVLVEEDTPRADGRRSGRIARVLTRRNPTMVGIFHYARSAARRRWADTQNAASAIQGDFVQPLDDRMGGPIEVAGAENAVLPTNSAHRTLGDEARRRPAPVQQGSEGDASNSSTVDPGQSQWPLEGLAVEVEILQYAQGGRPARGRLLEILGPPDAFGVDVEIVIRKHGIPHTFPAHVLGEAEGSSKHTVESLAEGELALRQDFRDLPVVTIDGETARDFDDAVLVRELANGNTELQVHIADVGYYVPAGSALDTEARVRGTSVYFPDRAVPMLPHALSSGMCSLLPEQDRLVLSCVMEIDARGEILGYRVCEGIIRSARRMTYTAVQHCLNASPAAAGWNGGKQITPVAGAEDQIERERIGLERPELPSAFDHMLELALRLNAKRVRRGSIDFDLPEPVVQFDPDGNMKAIVRSERGWAHRLIEEFMLSANECVATWLTGQDIASIYRIHEMPSPKRIVEFEETAAGFGQTLGIGNLPVKRLTMKSDRRDTQRQSARGRDSRPAQAHELPASIPVTPQMYQKLVSRIAGKPEERILSYLMLRSLKQARYAEKNEGHFALASPCYTHFTSPIRRYPDLIVHRLLRAMLRSGADPRGGPILSGDPQPWATELARSKGQHAAAARPTPPAPVSRVDVRSTPANVAPLRQLEGGDRRSRKRDGRVGWSDGTAGAPSSPAVDSFEDLFAGESAPLTSEIQVEEARTPSGSRPVEPISAEELTDIAAECSQTERRAADAERELIEWKKMKFMADRVGDEFSGLILSVTKFGFFVELDELFIEGLVPLSSLGGDFYSFRDTDRSICGARTGHCFGAGQRVEVILDRIDRQQRRLQFALKPGTEPTGNAGRGSLRAGRSEDDRGSKKARKTAKVKVKAAIVAKAERAAKAIRSGKQSKPPKASKGSKAKRKRDS